jgi:RNA polymerase sigma-70 factor (ECF subfamily)
VPDFADELLARMVDTERLSTTRTALLRLSPAEREVFVLYVWEGLSHAAVAEVLGVRPGTVRARLSRARGRLRKLTEDERQHESGSGQVPGNRRSADRSIQEKKR